MCLTLSISEQCIAHTQWLSKSIWACCQPIKEEKHSPQNRIHNRHHFACESHFERCSYNPPPPHDSRSLRFDWETLGMACLKDVLKYFIETKIYIYIFDSDCHKVRLMFRGKFTVGSLLNISFTRSQTIPLLKTFSIFCLELLTEVLENQKMWGSSKKGCWYKKMTHFNEDLILGVAITFFGGVCNNGRGWGASFTYIGKH